MPEDFALKMWDSRTELELAYNAIARGSLMRSDLPLPLLTKEGKKKALSLQLSASAGVDFGG